MPHPRIHIAPKHSIDSPLLSIQCAAHPPSAAKVKIPLRKSICHTRSDAKIPPVKLLSPLSPQWNPISSYPGETHTSSWPGKNQKRVFCFSTFAAAKSVPVSGLRTHSPSISCRLIWSFHAHVCSTKPAIQVRSNLHRSFQSDECFPCFSQFCPEITQTRQPRNRCALCVPRQFWSRSQTCIANPLHDASSHSTHLLCTNAFSAVPAPLFPISSIVNSAA